MAKSLKFNLTVIDKSVELENFKYRGLTERDKDNVISNFTRIDWPCITFKYDEGEVFITKDTIHSLIFSPYMTEDEEIDLLRGEDD